MAAAAAAAVAEGKTTARPSVPARRMMSREFELLDREEFSSGSDSLPASPSGLVLPAPLRPVGLADVRRRASISGSVSSTSMRVAFADSEPFLSLNGMQALQKQGFYVRTLSDARLMLQQLAEAQFDVLLLDFDFGRPAGGLDVLEKVRSSSAFQALTVVLMVTSSQSAEGFKALALGADDVVVKPLRARKLIMLHQLVLLKRKEAAMSAEDLAAEHKQRQDAAHAMAALTQRLQDAIDAPLDSVLRALREVVGHALVSPELRKAVSQLIAQLDATRIATQGFANLVESSPDMDDQTKAWLLDHVRQSQSGELYARSTASLSSGASSGRVTPEPEQAAEHMGFTTSFGSSASASSGGGPGFAVSTDSGPALVVPADVSASGACAARANAVGADGAQPAPGTADACTGAPHALAPESIEPESGLINQLLHFEFRVVHLSDDDMIESALQIFKYARVPELFHCTVATMRAFVSDVRHAYQNVPYHCWRHAFDVTQFCFWLLYVGGAAEKLLPLDRASLLIAALVHDVDHPGLNNNFLVSTLSPLAVRYNDASVLEKHHAARAFELGAGSIFARLDRAEFKYVRKVIVRCVIATDLALHADRMRAFDERAVAFDFAKDDDRMLVCELLLKCADISNPTRPFALSKYWSDVLTEENFVQGAREREAGLPISPFMDPTTLNQPKMSIGFIDFFVLPSMRAVERVAKNVGDVVIPALESNRLTWQSMATAAAAAASGPEQQQ